MAMLSLPLLCRFFLRVTPSVRESGALVGGQMATQNILRPDVVSVCDGRLGSESQALIHLAHDWL